MITDFTVAVLAFAALCIIGDRYGAVNKIIPESNEGDFTVQQAAPNTVAQNVKFVDTHSGYSQVVDSTFDSVRDETMANQLSLDEFFSRPVRIGTYTWDIGSSFNEGPINPWALYWSNPRVVNRIANYRLLRCRLCVKFVINGTPFHYGRIIASYLPLQRLDDYFYNDITPLSQLPHVYLDPTNSQGGELRLPYFNYRNNSDIVSEDIDVLGSIFIRSFQNLKHANAGTTGVSINVFAWAEDVKFSTPTNYEPNSIVPQSDEYTGPVSRIAGAVAKYAGMLTSVPTIGPFARATELGANAMGSIATLFGYSRPVLLEGIYVQPRSKPNIAVTNLRDDTTKLSLDAKQELSVDPRTVGLSGQDEMALSYVATRESYLTSFDWLMGTTTETLLWNAVVDPCTTPFFSGTLVSTAPAFATWPFKYWRGSMRFRFQVVSSAYHKGRLKIVYDPVGAAEAVIPPGISAQYNTAFTTVVDISDQTDFDICVGWGQGTTYREHLPLLGAAAYGKDRLSYNSTGVNYGNGVLAVYVVNELTSPNSTVNNDIQINVFVSMCDDFEVAVPTNETLQVLRLTEPSIQRRTILPQSAEAPPEEHQRMDSAPSLGGGSLDTVANIISTTDPANLIHFGERVSSFRQVLKRYQAVEVIALNGDTVTAGTPYEAQFDRPFFPLLGGPYPAGSYLSPLVVSTTDGPYVPNYMHLLQYVTSAYAGWRGGLRYLVDASMADPGTLSVERQSRYVQPQNFYDPVGDLSTTTGLLAYLNNTKGYATAYPGASILDRFVNGMLSIELPYYSLFRFVPARRLPQLATQQNLKTDPFQESYTITYRGIAPSNDGRCLKTYVSTAEDFSCFFFLGAPLMYYEAALPSP